MKRLSETRLEIRQSQKLSQHMQTALQLLSFDLTELSAYMTRQIQENPSLEYVPPVRPPQDFAQEVRIRYRPSSSDPDRDPGDTAAPETAYDDLEQQLRLAGIDRETCHLAVRMVHLLNPRGYFTQDLDEFAVETGVPLSLAKAALHAIQGLEPAGIGARNVEECLALQLAQREQVDPLCYDLIKSYLLEISKGNYRLIARETGATIAHVKQCVDVIRTLTPIPCMLREEKAQYIMPEFSVEADAQDNLTIVFHNDYYPNFRTDPTFLRLAETLSGHEKAWAKKMIETTSLLIQAIEMRQSTIEQVANIIVREQRPFFLGQYSLLPLRCDIVAAELGIHESTVYRAIKNKYLYCSRGTFPLQSFFQREYAGGISAARVKEMIRELCASDSQMSDRRISEILEERGIKLSRRTVAKYRSQMDITSSYERNPKGADYANTQ